MKDSKDNKQSSKDDKKENQTIKTNIRAGNDLLSDFDPSAVGSKGKGSGNIEMGLNQSSL